MIQGRSGGGQVRWVVCRAIWSHCGRIGSGSEWASISGRFPPAPLSISSAEASILIAARALSPGDQPGVLSCPTSSACTSPNWFRLPGMPTSRCDGPAAGVDAGAVPLDRDGSIVGVGDVRVQARQTLDNLMVQLAAGGAGGGDVLKTTVYVASTDRDDLVAVWAEVQQSPIAAAASTLLGVALLGYSGAIGRDRGGSRAAMSRDGGGSRRRGGYDVPIAAARSRMNAASRSVTRFPPTPKRPVRVASALARAIPSTQSVYAAASSTGAPDASTWRTAAAVARACSTTAAPSGSALGSSRSGNVGAFLVLGDCLGDFLDQGSSSGSGSARPASTPSSRPTTRGWRKQRRPRRRPWPQRLPGAADRSTVPTRLR